MLCYISNQALPQLTVSQPPGGQQDGRCHARTVQRQPQKDSKRIIIRCPEGFGFRASDVNQEQIICTECIRVVSAPHSNTSNLFNHLKNHHKPQYDECIKARANVTSLNLRPCPTSTQKTITATLHSTTAYPSTSQRHTEITDAIAFHLAKDMCPINTVSNEGFRKMVKTLDKRYVIPKASI